MISGEELLGHLERALGTSTADQTEIVAERIHQSITRYASSTIHQTTVVDDLRVWVRAVVGKSVGRAVGDSVTGEDLAGLVQNATTVAHLQAPNPVWVSLPEPETVSAVQGYDAGTAHATAADRAAAVGEVVRCVSERGWTASGTYQTEGREITIANSLGVRTVVPSSMAYLRALPDSGRGTGYAAAWSHRASDLDPQAIAREAMERCALNQDQREVSPGEYETILGDLCVSEALFYLARHALGAQSYLEGSSALSGRMGERITGPDVTIWDDPTDPSTLAFAADYEGIPTRKLPLIERGIASGVAYDSYTANRVGERSTGHAPEADSSGYGPTPTRLFMAGGQASLAEMIRSTRRGLLLTRFHYTHCPDPKRVVMTGTTRDGTFLVEDGEIVGAVRNLRLTQSVLELFEGIQMIGPTRLCQDWWSSNGMGRVATVCPPIKVERASFSSGTLF